MDNNDYNSYTYSDEEEEIRIGSLIKKMMSHTKLMVIAVVISVILSFVYAYVLYEPAYDASASFVYEVRENSTFTNLYGVKYKKTSQVVQMMKHNDTIQGFIKEKGLDPEKYVVDKFLGNTSISDSDYTINVYLSKMVEEDIQLQKEYIDYAINLINSNFKSVLLTELNNAKATISNEINDLNNLSFASEDTSNTNYQKILALKDNIKTIDIQIGQIQDDAIKISSEYMQTKVTTRGKTMVIIVLIGIVLGAAIDFFMSFFDNHIYFSTDISDIPYLDDHLLSCIPLYKGNNVSGKEFEYIINKLLGKNRILVSSISAGDNASFADKLNEAAKKNNVSLVASPFPSLEEDPSVLSSLENTDAALIVLKPGKNTIEEAKNFARDCALINAENYYFVINGINVTDPMVTKFESDSKYVHFNIFKFMTYREYYKKYLG